MSLRNAVQLMCYPNRIGRNLADLGTFIDRHLEGAVGGALCMLAMLHWVDRKGLRRSRSR